MNEHCPFCGAMPHHKSCMVVAAQELDVDEARAQEVRKRVNEAKKLEEAGKHTSRISRGVKP
jgi:hypothetical protein